VVVQFILRASELILAIADPESAETYASTEILVKACSQQKNSNSSPNNMFLMFPRTGSPIAAFGLLDGTFAQAHRGGYRGERGAPHHLLHHRRRECLLVISDDRAFLRFNG
jgi:hypothetical protein